MAGHRSSFSTPFPVLLAVVALLLLAATALPQAQSSVSFSFPADCAQPTSDSCPSCCKNLRNLAPAGEPSLIVKKVKRVDRCIAICSKHTYYALSNKQVCACFDECSVIEVPPSPFAVTSGLVQACMGSCFDPEPSAPKNQCPEHASPMPQMDGSWKCCCRSPFVATKNSNGFMCTRSDLRGALTAETTQAESD